MAWGPNLAPGRCEVPPSNGAPMIMMSVPAQDAGSSRAARGTPRNGASGPYILPSRAIGPPPSPTPPSKPPPPNPDDHGAGRPGPPRGAGLARAGRQSPGGRSAGSGAGGVAVPGRGLDPGLTGRRTAGQDPGQWPRQPPVGLAQQFHHGRHQDQPDQRGV